MTSTATGWRRSSVNAIFDTVGQSVAGFRREPATQRDLCRKWNTGGDDRALFDYSSTNHELLELVRTRGYRHFDEPVQLASGGWSQDFVYAKEALADGQHLRIACEAILAIAARRGIEFDAVVASPSEPTISRTAWR